MKLYPSLTLLALLLCCAIASSWHGYSSAKDDIIADMNQALAQTLAQKQEAWITPDTIIDYRSHLRIAALKRSSLIYYAMDDKDGNLRSRKMTWRNGSGEELEFQGFANCSMASVLAMSDQRPALLFSFMAALWAAFSLRHLRRQHKGMTIIGGLMMDNASHSFLTPRREPAGLTPMQEQLMAMFFLAEGHQLGKQEICDRLWPKKPDATDTLYTLIRRIKPVLASRGLTITSNRGRGYKLVKA